MKKVLIITYSFPPDQNIGARRPWGLAKYLPQFGWQPIVLTPAHPCRDFKALCVVETKDYDPRAWLKKRLWKIYDTSTSNPEKGKKRKSSISPVADPLHLRSNPIIAFINLKLLKFPIDRIGWYFPGCKAAHQVIRRNHIEAIISTFAPPPAHLIAHHLKGKHQIPWLADFRDLWSQNLYFRKGKLMAAFDQVLEKHTIKSADAIVSVSQPCEDTLKKLHKHQPAHVIFNGYDPEDFESLPSMGQSTQSDKLIITYTGSFYRGKLDPKVLFEALRNLSKRGDIDLNHLEIRLFCPVEKWISDEISGYELDSIVRLMGIVPREHALRAQLESTLLLLLGWNVPEDIGTITGKNYEYLNAKRPILAFGHADSAIGGILEHTQAGSYTASIPEIEGVLTKYYHEYMNTGTVRFQGDPSAIAQYSYKQMAKRFAEVLDALKRR